MIYHVLPGDAQVEEFRKTELAGEVIVCREAFITGPIYAADLDRFWEERAQFVLAGYGEDMIDYHEKVADELMRLDDVGDDDEVNLWFEYELFCSVNMWFCLDLLRESRANIFRVAPTDISPDDVWKGFGHYKADDLINSIESRTQFTSEDIDTGSQLWRAFSRREDVSLQRLAEYRSPCFPFLKEVCEAAAEIETMPAEIIRELTDQGFTEIKTLFPEFQKRAGVYGFGDLQIAKLLEKIN